MIEFADVMAGLGDLGSYGTDAGSVALEAGGEGTDWASLFGSIGDIGSTIGKGVGDFASGLGSVAKGVLPLANLGLGIAGGVAGMEAAGDMASAAKNAAAARGVQMNSATQAQALAPQAVAGTAEPLSGFGREELERAQAGDVGPASRAMIDNWIRGAKQLVTDRFARSGQGDSEQLAMALAWVDQQAMGLEQGLLDQMKTSGVNALGQASGAYGTAGQILQGSGATAGSAAASEAQEQQALQQLIQQMNANISRLAGAAA